METFTREIKFLSSTFDGEKAVRERIAKTATFQELSQTEKSQHELHFDIVGLMVGGKVETQEDDDDKKGSTTIDMAMMGKFVKKAIKVLLVTDQNFTETDKKEFLSDSGALLAFAFWYVPEKITPFFSSLNMT